MLEKTGRLISRHSVEQFNDVDQENFFGWLVQTIPATGTACCVYEFGISQGQQDLGQVVGWETSRLRQIAAQQICSRRLARQTRQGSERIFRCGSFVTVTTKTVGAASNVRGPISPVRNALQ